MTPCPKKRYGSRAVAKKVAKRMMRLAGARNLNAYLCDCGAWHVGHMPEVGRAALKSRRGESA